MAKRATVVSIGDVKDKQGRVDCLLLGMVKLGAAALEGKLQIPGLADALTPLAEKEINKHVPKGKVIPKEFENLAALVNKHVIQQRS